MEQGVMTGQSNSRVAYNGESVFQPDLLSQSTSFMESKNQSGIVYENGLFSSPFSDIFAKNLRLLPNNAPFYASFVKNNLKFEDIKPFESVEEIETQAIEDLLPDDDDLLSGIADNIGFVCQPNGRTDIDDDIFFTCGGVELQADGKNIAGKTAEFVDGAFIGEKAGINGIFAGEHPSRTLYVGNIHKTVEDSELRALFEQYGDIQTLYTSCKYQGFVVLFYYDMRAAQNAMRALQNKALRCQKLDIHFLNPTDNSMEKDINQGILVLFNVDSSVSNDDLYQIFGVFGEIKEIRETTHSHHHKYIEFYDVRAAEAALHALNESDIACKQANLEPSCSQGARSFIQQFGREFEPEELNGHKQGGSTHFPSGCCGAIYPEEIASDGLENRFIWSQQSSVSEQISPFNETTYHGISSSVPQILSLSARDPSVHNHNSELDRANFYHSMSLKNFGIECTPSYPPQPFPEFHNGVRNEFDFANFHNSTSQPKFGMERMPSSSPHPLPNFHNGIRNHIDCNSSDKMSAVGIRTNSPLAEGNDNRHLLGVASDSLNSNYFDGGERSVLVSTNESFPHHGCSYIWNNTNAFHHQPSTPGLLSSSSSIVSNLPVDLPPQMHALTRASPDMLNTDLPLHHVSAEPAANQPLSNRQNGYAGDSDPHALHPGFIENMKLSGSPQLYSLELASHSICPSPCAKYADPSFHPSNVVIPSTQKRCQKFQGPMIPGPGSNDSPTYRIKSKKKCAISYQPANKKRCELDIECIMHGEDTRTTLMIKNIPNKYTSNMLLAEIDENHRGTFDFLYLPMDFKNKCNIGYAFVNMTKAQHIIPFYQSFNGQKWGKSNSEKVALLAYARIQGKAALIVHFQKSKLMSEDERFFPTLFYSDGPNEGAQEPFPVPADAGSRTASGCKGKHQGNLSISAKTNASRDAAGCSSGSSKGLK